jgi:hypothetical protein
MQHLLDKIITDYLESGGAVQRIPDGERAVPPGIMLAAERGAIRSDVRAARADLIVPGITPPRGGKRGDRVTRYSTTPPPLLTYRQIAQFAAERRERQRVTLAIARGH